MTINVRPIACKDYYEEEIIVFQKCLPSCFAFEDR